MAKLFDLSIDEAARNVPGKPNPSAVWLWCRKGVLARIGERIYLEHQRFGGKLFTSEDALQRFGETLAVADREHFEPLAKSESPQAFRRRHRTAAARHCRSRTKIGRGGNLIHENLSDVLILTRSNHKSPDTNGLPKRK